MIEEKYMILINRFLDNEISSNERKELDEFLKRSEEGSSYFNKISKISSYFSKDEGLVPSENVKKNILNSIDYSKYRKIERTSYLKNMSLLLSKLDRKIVLSFCTGAAAVLLIFIMFGAPSFENENTTSISGTLATNNDLSTLKSNEYLLNNKEIIGKIHQHSDDDVVNIDFDIVAEKTNQILIYFDNDYLKFSEITNNDIKNFKFDLQIGSVLIETSGKSDFRLEFLKNELSIPPNSITLTINEEILKKN